MINNNNNNITIDKIIELLSNPDPDKELDLEDIKQILFKYTKLDYKKYISYNNQTYKKNIIFSNDKFDLILICWKNGQETKIHDHPQKCCFFKILEGCLIEENYLIKNNIPILFGKSQLISPSIGFKKSNTVLHKIIPIIDTISLHIYMPGKYQPNYFN